MSIRKKRYIPAETPDVPVTDYDEKGAGQPEQRGSNHDFGLHQLQSGLDAARSYCTFEFSKTTAGLAGGVSEHLRRALQTESSGHICRFVFVSNDGVVDAS